MHGKAISATSKKYFLSNSVFNKQLTSCLRSTMSILSFDGLAFPDKHQLCIYVSILRRLYLLFLDTGS